jgi:endogenous inhibitor of DNA gyrase (YacG/DUF329 family)
MPVIECRRCRKLLHYVKLSELPFFPFCSKRCQLIDLGGWLDEKHRISGESAPPGGRSDKAPKPEAQS